jgi:hypothetical protein
VSQSFAAKAFPFIVDSILKTQKNRKRNRDLFSQALVGFLEADNLDSSQTRSIIQMIQFLRTREVSGVGNPFERNNRIVIDYLELAKKALMNGMYESSVLFCEIDCDIRKCRTNPGEERLLLLLSAFEALGDKESFNGATQLSRQVDYQRKYVHFLLITYRYLVDQDWKRLFEYEQARCIPGSNSGNLLKSMNHLGFYGVMEKYMLGKLRGSGEKLDKDESEYLYEALWRNSQWNIPVSTTQIGILRIIHISRITRDECKHIQRFIPHSGENLLPRFDKE